VLCVSGGGALDEAAAAMLAQVLVERGFGARVVPSHEVSPGNVFRLDAEGVETIVISYLDAGGFANARYLVRRLRRRLAPSATIVLGLWTQSEAAINRSDVVDRTEANAVVTSLAQAVEAVATRGKEPEAQRVQ
jgi:methylmalonyl-CoA mutase cobalamin-binding subunit